MEFLDPAARKKRNRRRHLGYGLLSVLVLLATYILVATAVGFEIFSSNGEVVQNGLLFLDTKPVSANVIINGKQENDKTDSKLALKGGEYEIVLRADGYRDWTKRLAVEGGKVRFAIYPRLFPDTITATDVKTLSDQTGFTTQSPDRRWLLVQGNKSIPSFEIFDLGKKDTEVPSSAVVLPTSILLSKDGSYGTLEPVEWSDDNRHLLLKQSMADGTVNFLLIDRENIDASVNLNNVFTVDPTNVVLRDKSADKFYFYFASGGLVRPADLKARTVAEPILTQVLAFKGHGEKLLTFVTTKGATAGKVAVAIYDGNDSFPLGETIYDAQSRYFIDAAEFDGSWYYAVGSKQSDKVQVYKNPLNFSKSDSNKAPAILTTLRAGIPDFVGFSANTRFIMSQSGQTISVYDAEEKTNYRYEIPYPIDKDTKVSWIDGHRIQLLSGGKVYVIEFDGKNARDLQTADVRIPAYFDRDYERLFTVVKKDTARSLQLSPLVVKK